MYALNKGCSGIANVSALLFAAVMKSTFNSDAGPSLLECQESLMAP